LRKKLNEAKSKLVDLTKANKLWREKSIKYYSKVLSGGFGFGISLGILLSFAVWKWKQ